MQLEAWATFLSLIVVAWCLAGGIYLGAKALWALVFWARG
jgi:hypothetical protein